MSTSADETISVIFKVQDERPDWWPIPDGETFQAMVKELALFTPFSWRSRHVALLFLIAVEHALIERKEIEFVLPLGFTDIWDTIADFCNANESKLRKFYWSYINNVVEYMKEKQSSEEISDCVSLVLKDMYDVGQEKPVTIEAGEKLAKNGQMGNFLDS